MTLQFYLLFLSEKIFGSIFVVLMSYLGTFCNFFFAFWEITFLAFFSCTPKGEEKSGYFLLSRAGPADRLKATHHPFSHAFCLPTSFPTAASFPKGLFEWRWAGRRADGAKKNSPFPRTKSKNLDISLFFSKNEWGLGRILSTFFSTGKKNPPLSDQAADTFDTLAFTHGQGRIS